MKIAVSARSFCKNKILRTQLLESFNDVQFLMSEGVPDAHDLAKIDKNIKALIIGTEVINEDILKRFPKLEFISKYGVGLDNIDFEALNKLGIQFGYTAGVNRLCVAELTLSFMLGLAHNVFLKGIPLKSGNWDKNGGIQLTGKKVGVIGCGNVGQSLLKLLQPFNCELLINDIEDRTTVIQSFNARQTSKEEIFKTCRFITLHTPLNQETYHMINERSIDLMNHESFLINTARGSLVKHSALKHALSRNSICGAALDVFELEPPDDLEFLKLPNLMTTPHIGGNAIEAQLNMGQSSIKQLRSYFNLQETT